MHDDYDDDGSVIYRHVKTGGLYVVLHWNARIEATMDEAVVYQSLRDGMMWVRPKSEFMDGRFACVARDQLQKLRTEDKARRE